MTHTRFVTTVVATGALLAGANGLANVTFNFIPDAGTPQTVLDGFTAAGSRWSSVLANDITVNVNIGYQSLPPGVIGQTSGVYVQQDYAGVVSALNASVSSADDLSAYSHLQSGSTYSRLINHTSDNPNGANSATPYVNSLAPLQLTRANAKALGLLTASPDSDAAIRFSSNVGFDFNPADGVTPGQYDFTTMASHEIGHILGFGSVVDQIEQLGGSGVAGLLPATVLDLFRFSADSLIAGPGFVDNTADGRLKFFSMDGGVTSVAGFATGAIYGGGYQASHWREFTFTGLMDPVLFQGFPRQISSKDLRAFDVIGYTVPEPTVATLLAMGVALGHLCFRRPRN